MNKTFLRVLQAITIFSLIVFFATGETFGQTLKISDDIGGSGNSTESSGETDNTFIYVAAGLVIGGLIAYALLRDGKETREESDTTSVGSLLNEELIVSDISNSESVTSNSKNHIPSDIIFGLRKQEGLINENFYLVGSAVRF